MQFPPPLLVGAPAAGSRSAGTPRVPVATTAPPAAAAGDPLFSLQPLRIWRFVRNQPLYFWAICGYLFFEYVRPQQIYTWMDVVPWAQLFILLALGSALMGGVRFRFDTPIDTFIGVFSGVVLLSCATAIWPEAAFDKVGLAYFLWVLIYLLIANIVTTEKRFLVFLLSFLVYSFKMSQHGTRAWAEAGFSFQGAGVSGAPGWFQNSGEFGVQMAMFIPLVSYFTTSLKPHFGKKTRLLFYVMMLTAVVGTIGSSSRGAMIAAAVAILFMVLKSKHKFKALLIVSVLALFVNFMLPPEQRERFEAIGDDTDKTSVSRKHYWAFGMKVIDQYPVLGIGFANWPEHYQKVHGYKALPHNILIEVTAELGYVGLMAFLALVVCTFVVNYRTRKLMRPLAERGRFVWAMAHGLDTALIGFLVAGQFVTVTYYPFFWINLAMTVALHRVAQDLLRRVGPGAPPPASSTPRRRRVSAPPPAARPA